MYDPTVGRWISEDPIGFDGKDVNLYRYAGNSPTNVVDPTGLVSSGPALIYPTLPPDDQANDPQLHGSATVTQEDIDFKNKIRLAIAGVKSPPSDILGAYSYANLRNAIDALDHYIGNTGNTMTVSAKEFFREAMAYQNAVTVHVENLFTHAIDLPSITTGTYIQQDEWYSGSVEEPLEWKGIFRGYHSFTYGKVVSHSSSPTRVKLKVTTAVAKHYNFDMKETFGKLFDTFDLTGTKLYRLHVTGLAKNFQIWAAMEGTFELCKPENGAYTLKELQKEVRKPSNWTDNNSIVTSIPGYKATY